MRIYSMSRSTDEEKGLASLITDAKISSHFIATSIGFAWVTSIMCFSSSADRLFLHGDRVYRTSKEKADFLDELEKKMRQGW